MLQCSQNGSFPVALVIPSKEEEDDRPFLKPYKDTDCYTVYLVYDEIVPYSYFMLRLEKRLGPGTRIVSICTY